jgi:hypothetical protein
MVLSVPLLLVLSASPGASAWSLDDAREYIGSARLPPLSQDFFARCFRSHLTDLVPGGPPTLAQQTPERVLEIGRVIASDCFGEYQRQTVASNRWTPEVAALYEFSCAQLPSDEKDRCHCKWTTASTLFTGPVTYAAVTSRWHAANGPPVSALDRSRMYALADACLRRVWTARDRDALVAKLSEGLANSSLSRALRWLGAGSLIECSVSRYLATVPGGPWEEERLGAQRAQELWNEAGKHCGRALAEQVASSDEWSGRAVEGFTRGCVSSHKAFKKLCECLGAAAPRYFKSPRHLTELASTPPDTLSRTDLDMIRQWDSSCQTTE